MAKRSSKSSPLPPVKLALFTAFNAMTIHESLARSGGPGININALSMAPSPGGKSFKDWLVAEWDNILATANHEPVFDLAVALLKKIPADPQIDRILRQLAGAATAIISSKALLKHDISGRIYHRLLLPDVAKGLATFYTSIPAAYLLARLAVESPGFGGKWNEESTAPVVTDLACGSGTLLSAAYTALLDEWTLRELTAGKGVDAAKLLAFHQAMLQDGLYGFDVLEYATHLAASWLTLRLPEAQVRQMNIYTLPLGGLGRSVTLGSLSANVRSADLLFSQAKSLTGAVTGAVTAGITTRVGKPVSMPRPDLVIMNPPFARTGNVGKSILFGHLPLRERREVSKGLGQFAQTIKADLGESFGNAGLSPMFLWVGGRAVKDGGRIAFVLPRALFGGVFWEVAREFLVKRFHIDHLVIGYDPDHSWAWSEHTDLSEVLLVATKGENKSPTRVTYVRHNPRSALEGKILASRILGLGTLSGKNPDEILLGKRSVARSYLVDEAALRGSRNWNVPIGWASSHLNEETASIHFGQEFLGEKLPIVPLSKALATQLVKKKGRAVAELIIGYDVSPYSRHIRKGGPISLDALHGANESTLRSLVIPPNTVVHVPANDWLPKTASKLMIVGVGRFWPPTIGLVAVTTSRPAVSNTLWTLRLADIGGKPHPDEGYHAQALWLNSTPGLLGFLGLRQDSKGAFVQLKIEYVPLIPALNYSRVPPAARTKLEKAFTKLSKHPIASIPDQLRDAANGRGFRWELDNAVLDALAPKTNRAALKGIYEELLSETVITA